MTNIEQTKSNNDVLDRRAIGIGELMSKRIVNFHEHTWRTIECLLFQVDDIKPKKSEHETDKCRKHDKH